MIMIRVRILVAARHQTLSDDKVIVVMEFLRGRTEQGKRPINDDVKTTAL